MAKKILVIEDYPATVEMMENILSMEGYKIVTAADGPSGLEKVSAEKPDLILLDVMMPEMSGFDVCQKLKSDKKTSKIPIIIVSVRASEDSINRGKKVGADEYIPKPFDPFKLIEIVKKYLP